MSRAIDTINRLKLVQVMDTIVDADERRMIRLLLANTTLSIRIKDVTGTPFTTTTGTPQSDSLSPVLFACYLEAALREVRAYLYMYAISSTNRYDYSNRNRICR